MKKLVMPLVLVWSVLTLGGCASNNSVAPEWAQMGSANSESTSSESTESDEDAKPWWNPTSWF